MKKLLVVLLLSISIFTYSQDTTSRKAISKDITAEVNINPFSSFPVNINYLRFRVFTANNLAYRAGISIGAKRETPDINTTLNSLMLNLRPGFEKHFTGTNNLSPYIGADLDLAFQNSSFENTATNTKITGAWSDSGIQRGFTRIGANFIIGADYYFSKRIYLGTEFGFGFESTKSADIRFEDNFSRPSIKGGSSFEIGPNFNSSFRLGFAF